MTEAAEEKAQSLLSQIDIQLRNGNWRRMLELSRELLSLRPGDEEGHLFAGQALLNLEEFGPAEQELRRSLAANPQSTMALCLLALCHRSRKQYGPAEDLLRKALELDPQNAYVWNELAQLCHTQGDNVGAQRFAKKALALDPENVNSLNLLAMSVDEEAPRGKEKALEGYFKALEVSPEDPYVLNNIGATYHNQGQHQKAEKYFRQALALDPTEKIFRKNLYLALRHRSILYRILTGPGDLLGKCVEFVSDHYWALFIPVAIVAGLLRMKTKSPWMRPFTLLLIPLALFVIWFLVFKPLTYVYEYLIMSDIRAQAREVGARRGGLLGIHGWPFAARFLIFLVILGAVWTGIGFAVASPLLRPWALGALIAAIVGFCAFGWYVTWKEKRSEREAARRRTKFMRLERQR